MKPLRILIPFCIVLAQCTEPQSDSDLISNYYSEEESLELDRLSKFVIDQITQDCEGSTTDCLYQYFDSFQDLEASVGTLNLQIPLESQNQFLESLDRSLVKDIWINCAELRQKGKDYQMEVQVLCINSNGRFSKLLSETTKDHDKLSIYGEPFLTVQDYTPSMNAILLKQFDRFNMESKDEKLIMAIHLLTLNHHTHIE